MHPLLLERELVDLFMGTLPCQYYEVMLESVSSRFSNLVIVGEGIEEGLKSIKIQGASGDKQT